MANVPQNDPNVDVPAIVSAPVNPDHAPAQSVDAAIANATIATSGIDDDDNDTAPMDSQPHEPCGSPRDTQ
uniref:Uncharacterized protein n=1 Tax=Tanacetum cinerariifolium TaxID=118510 RepID=A0A699RD42_TANCI|nr:hypothetical protein [Tanacetum cinerariifolium]